MVHLGSSGGQQTKAYYSELYGEDVGICFVRACHSFKLGDVEAMKTARTTTFTKVPNSMFFHVTKVQAAELIESPAFSDQLLHRSQFMARDQSYTLAMKALGYFQHLVLCNIERTKSTNVGL